MRAQSTSEDDLWPTFFHKGMAVGYFEEDAVLTLPSTRRYMPYRGLGHYEMVQVLQAGRRPRCSYLLNGELLEFLVLDSPSYGSLTLSHPTEDRDAE